jgi:CHAT domain-containing protein
VYRKATTSLIISFYDNYSKNHRGAGALGQAMLKTMKKYPNPKYWAAFRLIGT